MEKMDATGWTLDGRKHTASLEHAVKFSGWSTPTGTERSGQGERNKSLMQDAKLAGWTTPKANDSTGVTIPPGREDRAALKTMGGWATPTVQDAKNSAGPSQWDRRSKPLNVEAHLSGWATPNTMDHLPSGNYRERRTKGGCVNLKDQVGAIPTGSPARTGGLDGFRLNAAFSRWLQAYPPAWDVAAVLVSRHQRKRRRKAE